MADCIGQYVRLSSGEDAPGQAAGAGGAGGAASTEDPARYGDGVDYRLFAGARRAWTVLKVLWLEDPKWREPNPMMGGLPALKVAYGPDVESKFIDGEVLAAAGQNGLAWPAHPAITQIQRSMADALNMAMSGALEPQEALDLAAAEVDEILLEY